MWVMLFVLASECYACLEHERVALLQLKAYSINQQNGNILPTWVRAWEGETTIDCCKWERVKCNTTTGRVIQLSLDSQGNYRALTEWYLNASIFLPFEELERLDLSWNRLAGWPENEGMNNLEELDVTGNYFDSFITHSGFERPSVLGKLEVLDLSWNSFNNSILPSLAVLSSLRTLSLCRNYFDGSFDIGEFHNMSNLEELDLSSNSIENIKGFERLPVLGKLKILDLGYNLFKTLYLSDNINLHGSRGFERLSVLGKLEVLRLDMNSFKNSILPSLGVLSSLKTLSLSYNNLNGSIDIGELHNMSSLEELDLSSNDINNIKGLKSLSKLKMLNLRSNKLKGLVTSDGFERLSVLGKLEVLRLDMNSFKNSILPFLGVLSSLKTLSLSYNNLNGSIDIGELHNMSSLEELDLSSNDINNIKASKSLSKLKMLNLRSNKLKGLVTSDGLDELKHLQELYLDYSSIDKIFLHNVGVMSSLMVLTLRGNGLNGSLPNQGWCELSNLQELDLSQNGFNGTLPSCLENLTSIRTLDLSVNQLTGNLTSSPLTNLTTLEYLILSYNHFEISVSFISFCNHSKLKVFFGDNNRLSDQIESQTWVPKFQLQVFSLSNCGSNNLGMKFPHFLFYQYDLGIVDLSHISIGTTFPVWLLENNTRLEVLHLINCSLIGSFLLPSYHNPHVISIDISDNHLKGPIPRNIGSIFPNMLSLNTSRNHIQGRIPTLGNMYSLELLDLSNNHLSGEIPKQLTIGCPVLFFLKLSNNNLSGQISPSFVNLTSLQYLYLDNNHFEGKFPNTMSIPPSLVALGISKNQMSGKLPRWMGNMSNLMGIAMFSNHFEGPIPVEFCKLGYLEFLDISENNLSGSTLSCFNQSIVKHVHLNRNQLSGPMTHAIYNSSSLVTLDLSDNHLTGTIPSWIGSLHGLSILLLKFNNFDGEIPVQLCQLKQLSILDLSQNNFFGPIPPCFGDIPFEATHEKSSLETFYVTGLNPYLLEKFMKGSKSLGEQYFADDLSGSQTVLSLDVRQEVEFTTKHGSYPYKGKVLDYMTGVDLSCNHLTGEIPLEIGNLSNIHDLNLSHNNLFGSIPSTFSQLRQIESLDLSYNRLNGSIPSQLIELDKLAVFSVAHNNLLGATPDRKAQFATFEESSYEGNPLLCGLPLQTNCTKTVSTSTMSKGLERNIDEGGFIDMEVFYVSFLVSYVIVLLGIVAVLFINPHWRQAWFHLVEVCMTSWDKEMH
ncbi:Receptor-like protein 13 [Camellia lanceoleosa]|uniref:Receptor-like protein 13 n=1 Tax=Camellia lanceoleosa TaxID=1840588 RepID=A0ACC0FUS6_9ERIC|nr:Receptor-like protein 13 [Camellia lanceoleosa]